LSSSFVCERKFLGFRFFGEVGKGKCLSRTIPGQNFQGQAWDGQGKDKPEGSPIFEVFIRLGKKSLEMLKLSEYLNIS